MKVTSQKSDRGAYETPDLNVVLCQGDEIFCSSVDGSLGQVDIDEYGEI